jgi:3-hydroxyacyl-[acyl-carrier-protein] dehydratase
MREPDRVRAVLPQRHPMLLVDRVLDLEPGRAIRAVKAVTVAEPCYAHLPDDLPARRYAYPVPLLIESLGQAAALLWLDGAALDDDVLLLAAVRDYVVEGPVHPGDVVRHEVRVDSVKAGTAFAHGESYVDERRIAVAGTLIAARRPRSALDLPRTPSQPSDATQEAS